MPVTLLVTGAAGFLGLNIVERCLAAGEPVVALTDKPLFAPALTAFAGLPGHLEVVEADVRDRDAAFAAFKGRDIRAVIHGAAITLGPASALAPAPVVIDVNVIGTRNVLEAAVASRVGRFVYPSSSAVYGAAPFAGRPVTEDTDPRPAGVYGFTKLACERLLVDAAARGLIDVAIARVTAVFGPWEHDTGVRETLSPPFQLACAALAGGRAVMPAGGARDWTWSPDVAAALSTLASEQTLPRQVYNVSLGATWHPRLLADALARRLGRNVATDGPEDAATIAFNDDVTATRSPIDGARLTRDLGVTYVAATQAAELYADWVLARGNEALGINGGAG